MKKMRSLLATVLAVLMSVAMAIPAFAAEVDAVDVAEPVSAEAVAVKDDGVAPLSYTNHTTVRTNGSWVIVASDSGGFNCSATISIPLLDGLAYKVDIGVADSVLRPSPTTVFNDVFGQNSSSKTIALGANQVLFVRITARTAFGGGASSYTVNTTINK